ncbi:MAG: 4'-phosphopantetheinyl transferase superfamily protein [Lachnospiraceae bacterium]|nr:4'-phosphopantetheinyl transferase superfamily protein [Lachnospiraceae bacterium]
MPNFNLSIYYIDHSAIEAATLEVLSDLVSPERRERAASFRQPGDATACLCSELLLRYALRQTYGTIPELHIETGPQGKPCLPELPDFHYSISHSYDYAAIACSDRPIGLDIQKLLPQRNFLRLAERFFTPEEVLLIRSASAPREQLLLFTKIWAMKESYVKLLGTGLLTPLNSFQTDPASGMITPAAAAADTLPAARCLLFDSIPEYPMSVCQTDLDTARAVVPRQLTAKELLG